MPPRARPLPAKAAASPWMFADPVDLDHYFSPIILLKILVGLLCFPLVLFCGTLTLVVLGFLPRSTLIFFGY